MKRVVICGSGRFKEEIRDFAAKLRDEGVIVYEPLLADIDWVSETNQDPQRVQLMASGLSKRHTDAIRMADVVFVYNKGGYVGRSTSFELGFARGANKPVWCLETPPTDELYERDEVEKVIERPSDVAHFLRD